MLCVFVFRFLMIVYLMCVLFFTLLGAYNKDDDDDDDCIICVLYDVFIRQQ